MNTKEKKMFDILIELKEKFNVFSVKAEFEAEGTRTDDLLRPVSYTHLRANETLLYIV